MNGNVQTKTKTVTKKERLLSNTDIRRWYENIKRSSKLSAEIRLRRLGHFCTQHEITPMQLAELGIKDSLAVADLIQDHISWMEQMGKSPGYIKSTVVAVKSWLSHYDVRINRKIRIANADATPTLAEERVPEGNELTELFNRANLRTGACIALIAKSGVRPQVLGNTDASDGLTVRDLPDLAIVQGIATFKQYPSRIIVRKSLSKAKHEYFTFITPLGAKKLLAYLNERILQGESLAPNSPVIAPFQKYPRFRGENTEKGFIETARILYDIRKAMRPRFQWRPYVLRAFFDTELLIAESRGKIAHDFRVFFMGHKGSIEAKYTTNKSILPNALITEMREAFKRSSEFLDLEISEEKEIEKQKEDVRTKIETLSPEELARVQELVRSLTDGKTEAVNGLQHQTKRNNSSTTDGSMSEHCQVEKSSSKTVPVPTVNADPKGLEPST